MTHKPLPAGMMTALVTPLHNDELDLKSLAALIEYQIANGASGLVASGGTGEYGTLSFDERSRLIRAVVEIANGRVPVIAATGCLSTLDAILLSQDAQASGVLGLLVVSSYGEAINWRERRAFYTELDASVSVPIIIYNTPPAGLLTFEQIRQLSELKNVGAVKDSSGDPELMGDLLAWAKQDDFGVYVGKDSFLYEAVSMGARGVVFGAANFIPSQLSQLIAMLKTRGSTVESLALWARIRPLLRVMEGATNYVALCKIGCKLRGIDVGDVRRPYLMPDADEVGLLTSSLKQLGQDLACPVSPE